MKRTIEIEDTLQEKNDGAINYVRGEQDVRDKEAEDAREQEEAEARDNSAEYGLPAFDKTGNDCGITTVRAHMAGMEGKRLTYQGLIA